MTTPAGQDLPDPLLPLAVAFVRHQFTGNGPGRVAVVQQVVDREQLPEFLQALAITAVEYGQRAHGDDFGLFLDHHIAHLKGVGPTVGAEE